MNIMIRCWEKTESVFNRKSDKWFKVKLLKIYRDPNCTSGTMVKIAKIPKKKAPPFPWESDGTVCIDSSYLMDTHFRGNNFCVGLSYEDFQDELASLG